MNLVTFFLLVGLLSVFGASGKSHLSQPMEMPQCQHWVDSVYNSLDERQRVAQLMIANVSPKQGDATKSTLRSYVQRGEVGGILFSAGSLEQYAEMTNYAQSLSKVPLLMTLDGEWGLAMRVPDSPRFPKNMALGAIQDLGLLYDYGQEVARECQAMGIHVNFAPVADVNSNPANPIIGYRSFGEDPQRVARQVTAYALGLENGGVMSVAKHFPGHGDTSTDSHKTLPVVNRSRTELDKVELVPFREYINAGGNGIMVGHISMPTLDKSGAPASMSKPITTGLLQDELGFKGMVFTDGLGMEGAAIGTNRCVSALKAGADALLNPLKPIEDTDKVLAAIKSGELNAADIERKVRKMLAYKYALGLSQYKPIDRATVDSVVNSSQANAIIAQLADASATLLRNESDLLPLADLANQDIAVVNIGKKGDTPFTEMCEKYAHIDVYDGAANLAAIRKHSTVIAAVYADDADSRAQLQALKDVPNLVMAFMINPYKMGKHSAAIPVAQAIVTVYDDIPASQRAAAKAIFGGIEVDGRFPVNVKGVTKMGDGMDINKSRLGYGSLQSVGMNPHLEYQVDSLVRQCLKDGAFPGCQVLIARKGDVVLEKYYGVTTKGGEKVNGNTLYDLASLSKVVGTLPGVMKTYDLGYFDLDGFVSDYVPGLRVDGKDSITPRMMLYHESGLRSSLSMYHVMIDTLCYQGTKLLSNKWNKLHPVKILSNLYGVKDPVLRKDILSKAKTDEFNREVAKGLFMSRATLDTLMNRIYASELRKDCSYSYSDLNFCLLMDMEQKLTGQYHDKWVRDSIWGPIGAYNFTYRAADKYPLTRIAATENDNYLRQQHIHGYVHDELAAFSGGVQGNAGVFGTATDVAKLCQLWLNNGRYGDKQVFSPETSVLFTTDKSPNSRRGLGFDKPDPTDSKKSPTCDLANPSVYGHTGFTGTCLWVDPENQLIFVFLSNRVNPTRENPAFTKSKVRETIQTLIYQAIQ